MTNHGNVGKLNLDSCLKTNVSIPTHEALFWPRLRASRRTSFILFFFLFQFLNPFSLLYEKGTVNNILLVTFSLLSEHAVWLQCTRFCNVQAKERWSHDSLSLGYASQSSIAQETTITTTTKAATQQSTWFHGDHVCVPILKKLMS